MRRESRRCLVGSLAELGEGQASTVLIHQEQPIGCRRNSTFELLPHGGGIRQRIGSAHTENARATS